jgi:hypothetical protein
MAEIHVKKIGNDIVTLFEDLTNFEHWSGVKNVITDDATYLSISILLLNLK